MALVIESVIWVPNSSIYILLFVGCVLSIYLLPDKSVANVLDHTPRASLLRFQFKFLTLLSMAPAMEGLLAAVGENELAHYRFSKDQMLALSSVGFAATLFIGSFLGVLSDLLGHNKLCLLFFLLHLLVSVCKLVFGTSMFWLTSILLALASSIYSFGFEAWMVVEHDKLGLRQELLNDMFWLMTFSECSSFIVNQAIANYLLDGNAARNVKPSWIGVAIMTILVVGYLTIVTGGWQGAPQTAAFKDYRILFQGHIISDKRIWLLSWTQSCVCFSVAAFWILWAPSIVADGREVSLGLIHPCLLGSKMLGSTGFPWLFHSPIALRLEEYLLYALTVMGVALSIVAFDYQEIGVLLALFCLFQTCLGVSLPLLARLRTTYVPNEIRGGIMSLSLMPANAAILFLVFLRSHGYIANSSIFSVAAVGLFSAAGCMHALKKWDFIHSWSYGTNLKITNLEEFAIINLVEELEDILIIS